MRIPGLSGLQLQSRLRELGSTLPIIFITGHADIAMTVQAIRAGAEDFLIKPVSSDLLLHTVEKAVAHHSATYRLKSYMDVARSLIATLTAREKEVFRLIIGGQTNKHAARSLGCSERTIKAHRKQVMEKLQVESLAELVSVAERVGIVRETSEAARTG